MLAKVAKRVGRYAIGGMWRRTRSPKSLHEIDRGKALENVWQDTGRLGWPPDAVGLCYG